MDVYLVGGAVRDGLLGLPVRERDWVVVGAQPNELLQQGFAQVGRDFPVFLHPASKEEYALARTERKTGAGHTGFDCYSAPDVTLEEDLQRRDLTINAIAKAASGEFIDPWGGRRDLADKVLRHVSDAFLEDPLRVLRVARFMARLGHMGFRIAPETATMMTRMVSEGQLRELTPERVWAEISGALDAQRPDLFFRVLDDLGGLDELIGELADEEIHLEFFAALGKSSGLDKRLRFAGSFQVIGSQGVQQFAQKYRIPSSWRELALSCVQLLPALREELTPASLADMLQTLDSYRRKEKLLDFMEVAGALEVAGKDTPGVIEKLHLAHTLSAAIDVSDLIAGLDGPAIGAAIRQRRLEVIERLLSKKVPGGS